MNKLKQFILIILAIVLVMPCQAGAYSSTWTSDKPDRSQSVSEGFLYIGQNFEFLENVGNRQFVYYGSDTNWHAGWLGSNYALTQFIGPIAWLSSSSEVTNFKGDITEVAGNVYADGETSQIWMYSGTAWVHVGSIIPNAATGDLGACAAGNAGQIKYDSTTKYLKVCNDKDGSFGWDNIADAASTGITGLTGGSGGTTSGATVTLAAGTGITTVRSGDTITITNTVGAANDSIDVQENVWSVSPGSVYAPTSEWVGASNDDTDGFYAMWFKGTNGSLDQIQFSWRAPDLLDITQPIYIVLTYLIKNTNATSKAVFRLSGNMYNDTPAYSNITETDYEVTLPTTYWPGGTASPFPYSNITTLAITAGEIIKDDYVSFSLRRYADAAADNFLSPVGIWHIAIKYRRDIATP